MRGLCHPGPFPEQRDRKWPGILGRITSPPLFRCIKPLSDTSFKWPASTSPADWELGGICQSAALLHPYHSAAFAGSNGAVALWLCGFVFERRTSLLVQWVKQHSLSYSWTWHGSETHTLLDDGRTIWLKYRITICWNAVRMHHQRFIN